MTSSTTTAGRKETERTKLIQEKCQTLLTQMLRDEDNKYCVDCDAKGPRWASWNLGVFLCIRCAGIHRNLGVHISRVKSVNLDTWTPEQVISLQQMGNSRARAVYEAQLPDGFRRPQTDTALESFIRAKYEHKKYIAREWVPPSPPKVDWAKEIDEELERQKRKKKAAQASASLGVGIISGSISSNSSSLSDKKSTTSITGSGTTTNSAKNVPLPAPLPKPKSSNHSGNSPKTQRISIGSNDGNQQNNDLLGLSSPIKIASSSSLVQTSSNNPNMNSNNGISDFGQNDSFNSFLNPSSQQHHLQQHSNQIDSNCMSNNQQQQQNSLAKEEEDFFNQGSLSGSGIGEKDASGKLTKDSILALYGSGPKNPSNNSIMGFGQNPASVPGGMFAVNSGGFAGLPPAYMSAGNPGMTGQQFMTPPISTSLYNTPVMTAPAAFSASGMNSMQMSGTGGFATQFPMQGITSNFGSMPTSGTTNMMGMNGTGLMQTTPSAHSPMAVQQTANNLNIMQTNQNLLSGLQHLNAMVPPHNQMLSVGVGNATSGGIGMGGMQTGMQTMTGMNNFSMPMTSFPTMAAMNTPFPTAANPNIANANSTANLNQQFGNLNLGNLWP